MMNLIVLLTLSSGLLVNARMDSNLQEEKSITLELNCTSKSSTVSSNGTDVIGFGKQEENLKNNIVDAYLHQSVATLYYKYGLLDHYIIKDKVLADFVLEEVKNEMDEIGIAMNEIARTARDHVPADAEACFKVFRFILLHSEYIIEKLELIATLGEENQHRTLKARLIDDVYVHKDMYPILVKINRDRCLSTLISNKHVDSPESYRSITRFVSFIMSYNFNDKAKILKQYNSFVMGFAVNSVRRSDFDTAKQYLNYLVSDNYLIDIADEICEESCSFDNFQKLILLLKSLPISAISIDGYVRLYVIAEKNNILRSGHALLLKSAIDFLLEDPSFVVEEKYKTQKEEMLNVIHEILEKLEDDFLRQIAENVSEYPLNNMESEQNINIFFSALNSQVVSLEGKIKYTTKIVEYLYGYLPNRVENICEFLKSIVIPESVLAGYGRLLDILMEGNNIYGTEIFKLANYIKDEPNRKFFDELKNRVPVSIRDLIWNKKCFVNNVAFRGRLYSSKDYYVNNNDKEITKEPARYAFTTTLQNPNFDSSSDSKFQFTFKYDKKNNFFTIENFLGSVLTVGKSFDHNSFRILFKSKSSEKKSASKWKLLIKRPQNSNNSSKEFTFQIQSDSENPQYIFASKDMLDSFTRYVLLSRSKGNSSESYWLLNCTGSERTDRENNKMIVTDSIPAKRKREVEGSDRSIPNPVSKKKNQDILLNNFLKEINIKRFLNDSIWQNMIATDRGPPFEIMNNFIRKSWGSLHALLEIINFSSWSRDLNDFVIRNLDLTMYTFYEIYNDSTVMIKYLKESKEKPSGMPTNHKGVENLGLCNITLNNLKQVATRANIAQDIVRLAEIHEVSPAFRSLKNKIIERKKAGLLVVQQILQHFNSLNKVKFEEDSCLKELKQFKDSPSNFSQEFSDRRNKLLPMYVFYSIKVGETDIATIYFSLLKNETKLYDVFDTVILFNFRQPKADNFIYFLDFIMKFSTAVAKENRLTEIETVVGCLQYSYTKLKTLNLLEDYTKVKFLFSVQYLRSIVDRLVCYNLRKYNETALKIDSLQHSITDDTDKVILRWAQKITSSDLMEVQISDFQRVLREGNLENKRYFIYKIIKYIYEIRHDNLETLSVFINAFPTETTRKYGYDALVKTLLSSQNTSQAINVANYVHKTYGYIPCFHTGCVDKIDKILPGYSKRFYEDKSCTLSSVQHRERDLFISGPYFVTRTPQEDLKSFSLLPEIGNSTDSHGNFRWEFEYIEETDSFLIKNGRNSYLSLGRRFGNTSYKLTFSKDVYGKHTTEWKIDLVPNDEQRNDIFTLKTFDSDKEPFFLITGDYQESGTVIVSKQKSFDNTRGSWWLAECTKIQ